MKGYIITNRDNEYNYSGVDASVKCELWYNLELWNNLNPNYLIEVEDIVFKNDNINYLLKYFDWLKSNFKNKSFLFLFISTQEVVSTKFNFLGLDCAYLLDDYGQEILFSTVNNELSRNLNIDFIIDLNKLNEFNLFNDYSDALSYINKRKMYIKNSHEYFETAFDDCSNLEIIYVYEVHSFTVAGFQT